MSPPQDAPVPGVVLEAPPGGSTRRLQQDGGPDLCDLSPARVEAGQHRVLDEATRQRRLSRQLEALEKDNFQVCVRVGGSAG